MPSLIPLPQNPALASYGWSVRLKQLLPWLSVESPTLSLLLRTSGIRQSLYVAYARHDAVSGAAPGPERHCSVGRHVAGQPQASLSRCFAGGGAPFPCLPTCALPRPPSTLQTGSRRA